MFTHLPSLVIFAVGIGVQARPLTRLMRNAHAKRGLARTMGTVVELGPVELDIPTTEQIPGWVSSTRYRPVVEFRTTTGEKRLVRGSVSVPQGPIQIGEQLAVCYDARDPQRALLDTHAEGLGTLIVPALLCGGCLFFGVIAWARWTL